MLLRPRFKPHLRVQVIADEGVFLLSEQQQTVLQGRLFELVAPCLDGRPTEEVCAALRGRVSPAQVFYTLTQLEQKGCLTEGDDSLPPGEAALFSIQQIDPGAAARKLAATPVAVRVVGEVDAAPFRALLQALHVRVEEEGELTVVLADGYLRDGLQAHNRQALTGGRPWLLVKPVGAQVWVGPLFRPGKTGCWECLADRMRANSPIIAHLEDRGGNTGAASVDYYQTPATLQVAWGLAANAVATWVASGELPQLEGKLRTLDVLTGEGQAHTLVRQPSCPACGQTNGHLEHHLQPLILGSSRKVFTQDGGHRSHSPEQTLERYGHLVSPITGAVSLLERDQIPGDGVLHVYLSGHNAARRVRSWWRMKSDLRSSNSGKGMTDAQARASALCEGLERYSSVFRGDEPRRKGRLLDLGDAAIHPNDCMHYSVQQYRDRDAWNARESRYDSVPVPFDPSAEIDWTPLWSLSRQTVRYLPTSFCYFSYPDPCDRAYCHGCSNGNAAGNTREEAILQGFFELVERDGVALWWYNRVRRPAVDLDSFNEPYLGQVRDFLRRHHRDLWVLDLTTDLQIPVFAAASRRTDGAPEQIMFGFGAHLDARVALLRAVTEMNQMLPQVLYTGRDEVPGGQITDKDTLAWLRTANLENQPYLVPTEEAPRCATSYQNCPTDDLKDDVLASQARVEGLGMEMLVLDLTRSEVGLPVVKVVVPGLRHFWPRLAPGRLYDVPVKLGWLKEPRTEDQLNPIPMFL